MIKYPTPSMAYLRTITDSTGVIQHGYHSIPNRRFGYTTDDNARALIVAAKRYETTLDRADLDLAITYLSFMHYATSPENKFRNVMDYERQWLDEEGTQDCYGRSIWCLGYVASSGLPENIRIVARKLFDDTIVWLEDLVSPRAKAYALLGICSYLRDNEDKFNLCNRVNVIADSLISGLKSYSDKEWHWYEPYFTYGNAILPLGMLAAAETTGSKDQMNAAISTMAYLTEISIVDRRLEVIGNNGWYMRGGKRAWYDQQSVDAGYIVELYTKAHTVLGDDSYKELAEIAYSWFFGNNRSGLSVYDEASHGCFDAIIPNGVNLNQGAESCICCILAQFAMQHFN